MESIIITCLDCSYLPTNAGNPMLLTGGKNDTNWLAERVDSQEIKIFDLQSTRPPARLERLAKRMNIYVHLLCIIEMGVRIC